MGFTINEKIKTELHYKDISLIAVAFGEFVDRNGVRMDKEQIQRMEDLVNRLGREMTDNTILKDSRKSFCPECSSFYKTGKHTPKRYF